jgi:hypothetical protein
VQFDFVSIALEQPVSIFYSEGTLEIIYRSQGIPAKKLLYVQLTVR